MHQKMTYALLAALLFFGSPDLSGAAMQPIGDGSLYPFKVEAPKLNANFTELAGNKVVSGSVAAGVLTLVRADATSFAIDVATLVGGGDATTITTFNLNVTTSVLTLTLSGGSTATVDLSGLVGTGGLADAPIDGSTYARKDGAWVLAATTFTGTAEDIPLLNTEGDFMATTTEGGLREVKAIAEEGVNMIIGSGLSLTETGVGEETLSLVQADDCTALVTPQTGDICFEF